jgi:peptidyl-prolyl cis-trans isomerase SurA
MRAKLLLLLVILCQMDSIQAQTLFTYGSKSVDATEFIRSYRKNATGTEKDSTAVRNYLEPFIRYKLKVQAALDLKMDTLANQRSDLASFREQVKPLYMLHTATLDSLIRLAHERSHWIIETSHQFIPKINGAAADTSFQYTGFITALTLPPPFEDAIYAIKDGEITPQIESAEGFHRFKKISTRKNEGKRSVFHVLIAVPDGATAEVVAEKKRLVDSLHQLVTRGESIVPLARQFSDDKSSATNGGLIEGIGVGQFDPVFEAEVFSLAKNEKPSDVFHTDYGFHILQLVEEIPAPVTLAENEYTLREQLLQDDRQKIAASRLIEQSIGKFGLITETTDKEAYISERLEKFNPAFAEQIREFRDGNLLFEIMDRMVWRKATADQAGLYNHYLRNKSKYSWQSSFNITTITSINKASAELVRKAYLETRSAEQIRKLYSEVSLVDTGRYEKKDILLLNGVIPYEGYVSDLRTNENDKSESFVIIDKIHKDPSPKSFEEAKGQVINDYQEYLENKWIEVLKKKYPIQLNKQTWQEILKKADQNTLLTAL